MVPHLIVDAGNLLFKRRATQSKTTAEIITAETIQQAYNTMGYDAVAVSKSDINAGAIFFENSKKNNFPWVSANIFDISGELLFRPFVIKKIGEIRVGIIGLTEPGRYKNDTITISGWEEPLRMQLWDLMSRTDMIVLLSNLTSSQNSIIAEAFPELDLIITANKRRGNSSPSISGNALIIQAKERGKYLGKLSMEFHSKGKWSKGIQPTELKSQSEITNRFKADIIAIRPKSPQSQEINLMIKELKKKINKLKRQ